MIIRTLTHTLALAGIIGQSVAQCTNVPAVYNLDLRTMSTNNGCRVPEATVRVLTSDGSVVPRTGTE
jgi:hypothetical protein